MPYRNIVLTWKFALGVCDAKTGELLHTVLYEQRPEEEDWDALEEEMVSDDTLFPFVENREWGIWELEPDVIERMKNDYIRRDQPPPKKSRLN